MTQTDYVKGKLYDMPLSDLQVDPAQPRKYFDDEALRELATSIARHGILDPVLVRRAESGEMLLVSGERRYRAALQAGLPTIPAILTDGNPAEIAIVENLLRENLTAIEEAEALQQLKDTHDYRLSDLSRVLGKSESTLCSILSLTKLPDEVKNDCRSDPKAARGILVEISRQSSPAKMTAMYNKLKATGMTRAELRAQVRQKKGDQAVLDLDFVRRFTKRVETLQPGNLDAEQAKALAVDLDTLRALLIKKLKALKQRPEAA